ncbi:MAG: DNA polymerase IV, partial [Oscillospiraceae bacterium]|nr:DNA polymerase IV [Oscillospiraceae bacterium]
PVKSVGNSTPTPRDSACDADAKKVRYALADSVGTRRREGGFRAGGIELWIRDTELASFTRQRALERATALSSVIASEAFELFRRSWDWKRPLRSLGVRAIMLSEAGGPRQLTLYEDEEKLARLESLERSVDELRRRFGHRAVLRGVDMSDDSLPYLTPGENREAGPSMYEMRSQH